jgi:hypothetical protein
MECRGLYYRMMQSPWLASAIAWTASGAVLAIPRAALTLPNSAAIFPFSEAAFAVSAFSYRRHLATSRRLQRLVVDHCDEARECSVGLLYFLGQDCGALLSKQRVSIPGDRDGAVRCSRQSAGPALYASKIKFRLSRKIAVDLAESLVSYLSGGFTAARHQADAIHLATKCFDEGIYGVDRAFFAFSSEMPAFL